MQRSWTFTIAGKDATRALLALAPGIWRSESTATECRLVTGDVVAAVRIATTLIGAGVEFHIKPELV